MENILLMIFMVYEVKIMQVGGDNRQSSVGSDSFIPIKLLTDVTSSHNRSAERAKLFNELTGKQEFNVYIQRFVSIFTYIVQ